MRTPFSDYTVSDSGNFASNSAALEFESPLVDPYKMESNKSFSDEEIISNESNPEMEELTASDLKNAVASNRKSMINFGWQQYTRDILKVLGQTDDSWYTNDAEKDLIFFTNYFANWQDKMGFNTRPKGEFGLNNWTYMQKKLGFHNLSNLHNINKTKAISDNKYYEKSTWKNRKSDIYKILAENKILKIPLPLNDEYFSYAVADFQALKGVSVDGILGPDTWAKMQATSQLVTTTTTPKGTPVLSRWHNVVRGAVPCNVEPLVDGTEAFKQMNEAIRGVNHGGFIYILGWMLDIDFLLPDMSGGKPASLYNLLNDAATQKDVEIRILIWKNPFYTTENNHALQKINSIKGNVKCFIDDATFGSPKIHAANLALRSGISNLPPVISLALQYFDKWKEFVRYTNQRNEGSHHEKIVLTGDAEKLTAFCGGMDINPDRMNVWHDTHCRLEGHAAWQLWNRFVQRWKDYLLSRGLTNSAGVDLLKGRKIPPPPPTAPGTFVAYAKILHTYNQWNGQGNDRTIRNTLKEVIRNAQRYVYFEDQYMVSCEIAGWLNERLVNVPGFKVIIITQDDEHAQSDLHFAKRKRAEFLAKLKNNIPDPTKVQVKQLSNNSAPGIHRKIHSKMYVVDGELMIIGSANCNRRSMFNDSETSVFLFKHETSGYNFIKHWNSKLLAFDPQQTLIDYAKNADKNFDDIDRKIYDDIKNASPYIAILNPAIASLAKMNLDPLLRPIFENFWEVIDPNPDNIICPLPTYISSEYEDLQEITQSENYTVLSPYENLLPSPGILKLSPRAATFLSPEKNATATKYNLSQVQKSGIALKDILNILENRYDLGIIEAALTDMNNNSSGSKFSINPTHGTVVDAVFTEAIHQFQIDNYLNPADQDAVLGQSTLETMGFINHSLRPKLSGAGLYGQSQLNRSDVKSQIPLLTNNKFTSANWYQYIMKPSWLGVKISDGIHLLLLRKLREAETWLLSQPQYKGMTPSALGKALGFTANTRYSGARLSSEKQAMHGLGLALDINVSGNPWIGAGWVKNDQVLLLERTRMLKALRNASGNQSLPGNNVFEYLDSIARTNGNDTAAAYNILKQRNDEFITYLKSNFSELSYWRKSQSFGSREPLNGFLNLHADLVYALRQIAGLAWGALDFGPRSNGDIMHFDLRPNGVGKLLCEKMGGFVPTSGHPAITTAVISNEFTHEEIHEHEFTDESAFQPPGNDESEFHEALGNEELEFDPAIGDDELEEENFYEDETKRAFAHYNQSAANIFLTLTGEKQGSIKGNVIQKGKEGLIAAYAFNHEIAAPKDAATGMAMGKRIHKPVTITKEVDLASAKILSALMTNERLKEVVINFWRPRKSGVAGAAGQEVNYYRVILTNASISNITQDKPLATDANAPIVERVELVYEKIEWQYLKGSNMSTADDWRQMN